MKIYFQFFALILVSIAYTTTASAQKGIQTDTLMVSGVCDMCEKRIEKAAFIKGVKLAEWDRNKQHLTVIYKARNTNIEQIAYAVADAGHDNSIKKAPDNAYATLPDCCAYRDGVEVH